MIEKRDLWLVGIAGVLGVGVVLGFHIYDAGKRAVALKSTQDSLAVVVKQSAAFKEQRDAVAQVLAEQIKRTTQTRTVYVKDSSKVTLHGDTAVTKDSSQVLLPEVAQRLRAADAHIVNLEAENASLRFALHADSAFIANQAEQIRLNQNIAKMVEGPKCGRTCGIVIGVASTAGAIWLASKVGK